MRYMASGHCSPTVSEVKASEQLLLRSNGIASNRASWIRQTAVFRNLSVADVEEIASAAKERNFPAKQPIFCEDDSISFILIIISGRVKVTQFTRVGKEVILRIHGAGELVDELSFAPEGTHRFTALPIETCRALAWELRTFYGFMQRFPMLQSNVANIVVSRLHTLQRRFCDLATERVPQRLARTLISLADQNPESSQRKKMVELSCEELSQMTGTTVFTVSRLLTQWNELGIIRAERRAIFVENLPDLINLAHGKDE
jgi:CRP-like cAMP-binding protein